jgi:hypothetical protein
MVVQVVPTSRWIWKPVSRGTSAQVSVIAVLDCGTAVSVGWFGKAAVVVKATGA